MRRNIEKAKKKPDRKLHGCQLGDEYLRINSRLTVDPVFENAVVKLQEQQANQLTDAEKFVVQDLRKNVENSSDSEDDNDNSISKQLNKRRRFDENDQYMSADFVLGSIAEVERIWSIAIHILSDVRNRLKPLIFEAILFLKYNSQYWGDLLVAQAIRASISEKVKKRLDELEEQNEYASMTG